MSEPYPVYVPTTPYVPKMPKKRLAATTMAALLMFVIGVIGLMAGMAIFVFTLSSGSFTGTDIGLETIVSIAKSAGPPTALVILVGAIMHGFSWYWLWGNTKNGGVVGVVNGFNDIIFPAVGILWLEYSLLPSIGLSLSDAPWLFPGLLAIMIVGAIILALLALGWKNLED